METLFTPYQALGGGFLIGLAVVVLMWLHGRILGATSILAGLFFPTSFDDWRWRASILLGMISAPLLIFSFVGEFPAFQVPVTSAMLITGGLIVGIGVTLGSGCTSGHGVCGIARLSPRSIVATLVFMLSTGLTVYFIRHVVGV